MHTAINNKIQPNTNASNHDNYQMMVAHDEQSFWVDPSTEYRQVHEQSHTIPYNSFEWSAVDHSDSQYTPSTMRSSQSAMSTYDLPAGPDRLSNATYMAYPDGEMLMESPHRTTSNYGSSRVPHLVTDVSTASSYPTSASQHHSEMANESQSRMSGVELAKRQKPNRGSSEQSAVSLKGGSNTSERLGTNSATTNEAHIIAERRYRNNLNAKITQIQTALQESRFRPHSSEAYRSRGGTYFNSETGSRDVDATSPNSSAGRDRRRKADILDEAAEYIRYADLELRHLSEEVHWLNQALAATQGQSYVSQPRHHGQ